MHSSNINFRPWPREWSNWFIPYTVIASVKVHVRKWICMHGQWAWTMNFKTSMARYPPIHGKPIHGKCFSFRFTSTGWTSSSTCWCRWPPCLWWTWLCTKTWESCGPSTAVSASIPGNACHWPRPSTTTWAPHSGSLLNLAGLFHNDLVLSHSNLANFNQPEPTNVAYTFHVMIWTKWSN